ncbi:RDD family protein [Paucibacter sp. APW11]|uniref:RDD family protein n=1 Tax=Roseateles aquae TaxID=3077235 RepID=A0ABU3PIT3_9BURK|nr:RDD family protein [Paucibacter sp. APW11]MDT9002023.1 RDD family protein [Paucibacter sp. APW11]
MKFPLSTLRQRQAWVSPDELNVAPALLGQPLATPKRRGLAMLIDLAVIGVLSPFGNFFLLLAGGLALVLAVPRLSAGLGQRWRKAGWVIVVLSGLLGGVAAWDEWHGSGAVRRDSGKPASVAQEGVKADPAASEAETSAEVAAETAGAAATEALEARVEQLEAELKAARKHRGFNLRQQLHQMADDIGTGFGWAIVYFSLLPVLWPGQTLGKRLMGLQVRELTNKPMTVLQALKRYGGYAAGMATGGLGFIQLLWDPNRQAIQDKTAHTVVIDLRGPREPRTEHPETGALT